MRYLKVTFFSLVLCLSLSGCKKKETEAEDAAASAPTEEAAAAPVAGTPSEAPASSKSLTPAEAVRAAMEKKQYTDAVRLVLQIQGSARTEQQAVEAAALKQEIKLALTDVANTDREAAQALGMLRLTTLGR